MTEAPRCEDCRHYQPNGEFDMAECENRKGPWVFAAMERTRGKCGPEGKLFEPKEGKANE